MKVFFDTTPSGIQQYGEHYRMIGKTIEDLGHTHTSSFIYPGELVKADSNKCHYQKIITALNQADVTVFEVSVSSLSTGQCLQQALLMGKPVIALHTGNREDVFLSGEEGIEQRLLLVKYDLKDIKTQLTYAFECVKEMLDVRFTLVIPPDINRYLNHLAETGINRSEFIRDLIRKEMEKRG